MEKVKKFQRNYLESKKFFSKFSPKPKSENFSLSFRKGKFPKPKCKFTKSIEFSESWGTSQVSSQLLLPLSSSKKVSENKNKTNYLINLEWCYCYYFKFFSQLLLLKLNLEWWPKSVNLKVKVKNFKRNYWKQKILIFH